ncbi:MAG: DNA topoisomerase IV subunit A [Spartobacteria bacterium]|nr:DNA topoisomerase IV subunit A [Spartobacteria bacterium]
MKDKDESQLNLFQSKKQASEKKEADGTDEFTLIEEEQHASIDLGKYRVPDGVFRRLMDVNFLQYASYVIRDRAIPDLEDGLKPVQRRILFSLLENDDGRFIKVANIVGYCMQFHPHGDQSISDALVTLANKRYLIEGQGNFGNLFTGDPAAASRYIECRLTPLARNEIFNNEMTEFVPTYDGRKKEPVTLPCKLPLLLMLGADGIAVGLATKILPHNFVELLEAQIAILRNEPFTLYPDFIQGGDMDVTDYDDGRGKIRVRAVIETAKPDTLIIREIPYGTTTESLLNSIEDAVKKKKLKIKSINDYTAERIEIEIKLAQGTSSDKTIEALYAFTHCEVQHSSNMVVIYKRRPMDMTVSEVLKSCTEQFVAILQRELELKKEHLLNSLHRNTLVRIFIEQRIYKNIEECETYEDVQQTVLDGVNVFRAELPRDVTLDDVEMLLSIKIRRISRYDMNKNRRESEQILADLSETEKNLSRITSYSIRYLKKLLKEYGADYPRRTRIKTFSTIEVKKLTEKPLVLGYDREKGYLGHTISSTETIECTTNDKLVIVWRDGRYKVVPPPDKMFVDLDVIYFGPHHRRKIITMVYTQAQTVTFIKRFQFGGFIMNKDYMCTPEGCEIILFDDSEPEEIYCMYKKIKYQRVNQQVFNPHDIPVKNVKAMGNQLTFKAVRYIGATRPRHWEKDDQSDSDRI